MTTVVDPAGNLDSTAPEKTSSASNHGTVLPRNHQTVHPRASPTVDLSANKDVHLSAPPKLDLTAQTSAHFSGVTASDGSAFRVWEGRQNSVCLGIAKGAQEMIEEATGSETDLTDDEKEDELNNRLGKKLGQQEKRRLSTKARKTVAPVRVPVAQRPYEKAWVDRGAVLLSSHSLRGQDGQSCVLHTCVVNNVEAELRTHLSLQRYPLEAKDESGCTALLLAVLEGKDRLVDILAEAGANVNITNKLGTPALYLAAEKGYVEVVAALLKHKADPNKETATKKIALHCAATKGHFDVVKLLVEHGADIHHLGGSSMTKASSMAKRASHIDIYSYLQEKMGVTEAAAKKKKLPSRKDTTRTTAKRTPTVRRSQSSTIGQQESARASAPKSVRSRKRDRQTGRFLTTRNSDEAQHALYNISEERPKRARRVQYAERAIRAERPRRRSTTSAEASQNNHRRSKGPEISVQLDSVAARGESNGTLPALEKQGELMQKIVDANGTATEGAAGLNTIKIINASNNDTSAASEQTLRLVGSMPVGVEIMVSRPSRNDGTTTYSSIVANCAPFVQTAPDLAKIVLGEASKMAWAMFHKLQ